jgi:putative endonuclease
MYTVYIIYSKKIGKKYIGVTEHLKERIVQHNNKNTKFTSVANDWKLVYYEVFSSKKDAYSEEKFLKTGKGRERLKYLLSDTLK